mgnify:CR=1 FL=1
MGENNGQEASEERQVQEGDGQADGGQAQEEQAQKEIVKKYLTHEEMLLRLELYIASAGSARALAREFEIPEGHVYKARLKLMEPTDALLEALGLKRTILYESIQL